MRFSVFAVVLTAGCGSALTTPPEGFDTIYRYGDTGGLVAYENQATLTPPSGYRYTRSAAYGTPPSDVSCAPSLPRPNSAGTIDAADVMQDLADPDVQQALAAASPPTYGVDARPVDGSIFQFLRADGRGFLAGGPCPPTTSSSTCLGVPNGVTKLVADLRALDQQQLQDPSCAPLSAALH